MQPSLVQPSLVQPSLVQPSLVLPTLEQPSLHGKSKFFYGQEPSGGESTTAVRGLNYHLLAVMLLK